MDEFLKKIEDSQAEIENYKLEITEGTKKMIKDFHEKAVNARNELTNSKIKEYGEYATTIKEILNSRMEELTPKDKSLNYDELLKKNIEVRSVLEYTNETSSLNEKLGFTRLLAAMSNTESSNLSEINSIIDKMLEVFKKAKIEIKITDFEYSLYAKKYMEVYLKYEGKPEFNAMIKTIFDEIYWSCPALITHLKLAFRSLVTKYTKELTIYSKDLLNNLYAQNNIKDKSPMEGYKYEIDTYNKLINSDEYTLTKDFLDGTMSPSDYMSTSNNRKVTFNKLIGGEDFDEIPEPEKEKYFESVKTIDHLLTELEDYTYFKPFLDDIIKRYKAKDTYKGLTKSKQKDISKEDGNRLKQVKSILPKKTLFGVKDGSKNELLLLKQNESIKALDTLYNELDEDVINDMISAHITETSSILDALKVAVSDYNYYAKLFEILKKNDESLKIDEVYERLLNFVFNPYNTFTYKINLLSTDDIIEIIYNKYKLLNITILKEDLSDNIQTFKSSIKFILKVYNVENTGIKFEDLSLINDIKKLG